MEQSGDAGDVCRLSDETETALNAAASRPRGARAVPGRRRLGGTRSPTRPPRGAHAGAPRGAPGARPLGEEAGTRAGRNYFAGPYLRDELLGMGVHGRDARDRDDVDRLQELYSGRRRRPARRAGGARDATPLVMCHVSHLYRSGASLYFSFFARQEQRRGARAVARGEVRGLRRDRRPRRARSPTTTPSGATTRRG